MGPDPHQLRAGLLREDAHARARQHRQAAHLQQQGGARQKHGRLTSLYRTVFGSVETFCLKVDRRPTVGFIMRKRTSKFNTIPPDNNGIRVQII